MLWFELSNKVRLILFFNCCFPYFHILVFLYIYNFVIFCSFSFLIILKSTTFDMRTMMSRWKCGDIGKVWNLFYNIYVILTFEYWDCMFLYYNFIFWYYFLNINTSSSERVIRVLMSFLNTHYLFLDRVHNEIGF